jgi:hypothetical protein
MIAGQVPETIMTGKTANISHIAEFGWYDWVMFRDNEPSFPDDKLILGCYLGPAIDTGLALTAKILKSNGVFVCRSTLRHLNDEEFDSPVHKDMRCKFDESIEHHLGPAALMQDFPAEDLTPDLTYYDDTNAMDPEYGDAEVMPEMGDNYLSAEL